MNLIIAGSQGRYRGSGGVSDDVSQVNGFPGHDVKSMDVQLSMANSVELVIDGLDFAQECWDRENSNVGQLPYYCIDP